MDNNDKDLKLEMLVDEVKQIITDWSESDEVTEEGYNLIKMTFDKDSKFARPITSEDEYQYIVFEVREDYILIKYSTSSLKDKFARLHPTSIKSEDVKDLISFLEVFIQNSHDEKTYIPGTASTINMNGVVEE